MALVTEFTCRHCRQSRHEIVTHSRICSACRTAIAIADRDAHMAKLAARPLDERVRQIELALYNLDAERRIAALESHHVRY